MNIDLSPEIENEIVIAFEKKVLEGPQGDLLRLCRVVHAELSDVTKRKLKTRRFDGGKVGAGNAADVSFPNIAFVYERLRGQDMMNDVKRAQSDPFFWLEKVTRGTENELIIQPFMAYSISQYMKLIRAGVSNSEMVKSMKGALSPVVQADVLRPLLTEQNLKNMCAHMTNYMSEDQRKVYDMITSGMIGVDGKIKAMEIDPSNISTRAGHSFGQGSGETANHAPDGGGGARENRYVGPNASKRKPR